MIPDLLRSGTGSTKRAGTGLAHPRQRSFLFLQGPHGPFFGQLADRLVAAGARVARVGFNVGDRVFWPRRFDFVAHRAPAEDWSAHCARLIEARGITDLVLYGDVRPIHAEAVRAARDRGITIHIFEEGYLRPFWITYERDGSNGNSRLMALGIPEMAARLGDPDHEPVEAPAHWGDMRQHVFYGALYHGSVLLANRGYRGFRPHRDLNVTQEFWLYFKRLWLMPLLALDRILATRAVRRGAFPYHLVLLQLDHDSNFQAHSDVPDQESFLARVVAGFAAGAPAHHHLVFKAHPLDDGRTPLRRTIRRLAANAGIGARVHFVRGGKLARLIDPAIGAVTVNSTAAQQALWRAIPLKTLGRSIYDKPELVSDQSLAEFFANPAPPDARAYALYRRFLLETSQIPGGFYSGRGRQQALRRVVDAMLVASDPYALRPRDGAAQSQQLQIIAGSAATD